MDAPAATRTPRQTTSWSFFIRHVSIGVKQLYEAGSETLAPQLGRVGSYQRRVPETALDPGSLPPENRIKTSPKIVGDEPDPRWPTTPV